MSSKLGDGIISKAFMALGIENFQDACQYVKALPYQRNSTKGDNLIVLKEGRGTCSSKHELIKRLAEENAIEDCKLVLCVFKMSGETTPKIASILAEKELAYLPEAHTYIEMNGQVNDFTFPEATDLSFLEVVLHEEEISADQIRSYKAEFHQAFIKEWIKNEHIHRSFGEIWSLREACILALSQ